MSSFLFFDIILQYNKTLIRTQQWCPSDIMSMWTCLALKRWNPCKQLTAASFFSFVPLATRLGFFGELVASSAVVVSCSNRILKMVTSRLHPLSQANVTGSNIRFALTPLIYCISRRSRTSLVWRGKSLLVSSIWVVGKRTDWRLMKWVSVGSAWDDDECVERHEDEDKTFPRLVGWDRSQRRNLNLYASLPVTILFSLFNRYIWFTYLVPLNGSSVQLKHWWPCLLPAFILLEGNNLQPWRGL